MSEFDEVEYLREEVEVPEFAPKREKIVVREITALERKELIGASRVSGQTITYDLHLVAHYGATVEGLDETGLGTRLFESVEKVRSLPGRYEAGIARMGLAILWLSGIAGRSSKVDLEAAIEEMGGDQVSGEDAAGFDTPGKGGQATQPADDEEGEDEKKS